jgi:RNA polymerase sigma factor (sigma-70 family)
VRVLLYEYKQSLRLARMAHREADDGLTLDHQLKTDRSIINSMISELEYVIEWIETGRKPGPGRGADRRDVYVTDPVILERRLYDDMYQKPTGSVSLEDRGRIEDALCSLSKREKEIFILAKVELLSYESIAKLLGIKKSTVQTHMERAEKKIEKRKNGSLFLVC